jgi:hypothetical protein
MGGSVRISGLADEHDQFLKELPLAQGIQFRAGEGSGTS